MPTAIEFDNIGKQYRLGLVSTQTLSHDLKRWWTVNVRGKEDPYLRIGETNDRSVKGESDYVWALKDINFKVEQGDVVGIIGRNGAGKSTLLKILSRVTAPTTGQIRSRGRIGSLLEVGTGFHPEMTGRENIFMNGAIMGMTRAEIARKLDEIVDFSGCERYLDTPVKRYSSGMTVRLGFAVAAFLEPEILVVDEVLAVGDAEFQKKAIGKMKDVSQGEGRTVLFVSHNMAAVRSLCKSGVVLRNGGIDFEGTAEQCVDRYLNTNIGMTSSFVSITDANRNSWVSKELEFISVSIDNSDYLHMSTDEPLRITMRIKVNNSSIHSFTLGVSITDIQDRRAGSYISELLDVPDNEGYFDISLELLHHNLAKGRYSIDLNIGVKDISLGLKDFDVVLRTVSFEIVYQKNGKAISHWPASWGDINFLDANIEVR